MLQFQAIKLISLNNYQIQIVNNKKFDAVLQPTGGQCPGLQLILVVTPKTDLCFKYSV